MALLELPERARHRSLADPDMALAAVGDLLTLRDRANNSALMILCDESGRAREHVVLHEIDWDLPAAGRARVFWLLAGLGYPQVVVAMSSRRPVSFSATRRWRHTADVVCTKFDVEILGFYCADLAHVWQPAPEAA